MYNKAMMAPVGANNGNSVMGMGSIDSDVDVAIG